MDTAMAETRTADSHSAGNPSVRCIRSAKFAQARGRPAAGWWRSCAGGFL